MSAATTGRFSWTVWAPVLGLVVLVVSWGRHPAPALAALIAVPLIGAVLAAVHHAEVVAHRVGEPFGSLILAVAVTVIEVGADPDADDQRRRGNDPTPGTRFSPRS